MTATRALVLAALLSAVGAFVGCGSTNGATDDNVGTDGGITGTGTGATCGNTPTEGCPCNQEGSYVSCGEVHEQSGDYVFCTEGQRQCKGGTWGACVGDVLVSHPKSPSRPIRNGAAPPMSSACSNNVCDPTCQVFNDTPAGFDGGSGFTSTDAGLTLSGSAGGGSCASLSVTPASGTLTITGINYTTGVVTTSPASVQYSAMCSGSAVTPSWTLSSYDTTSISSTGSVVAYSPVATPAASPITVTGTLGASAATASLNINVSYDDTTTTSGIPTAVITAFSSATVGAADVGTSLYPYKNTVFPLNLTAPVVQWSTGSPATPASWVKIELRYPRASVSSTPTFKWSEIVANDYGHTSATVPGVIDSSQPEFPIPQKVWNGFDRSAQGDTGEINIYRYYGSPASVHAPINIPVKFATDSLRGTAYYTQYYHTIVSGYSSCTASAGGAPITAASYTVGQVCPVGNCTHPSLAGVSTTRSLDMTQPGSSPADPFGGTAGCAVCHSINAQGTRYVSGSSGLYVQNPSGSAWGVDNIKSDGTFQAVSEPQLYSSGGDSRGFSYAAITPDGKYVLQGYNFWGNTNDTTSSFTTQSMAAGYDYKIFNLAGTQTVSGQTAPANATATGLASRAMMTPVFSPDGTKLAYVNGDGGGTLAGLAGGASNKTGWRKGITTMAFNESTLAFTAPSLVVNTWTGGSSDVPLKWPFWEPDNKTLTFVETAAGEFCASGSSFSNPSTALQRACYNASYGSMSPTTRGYWPGSLFSVDTSAATPAPVAMTTLNTGERAADANKAYQPSILPFTSGGYRWVIFTSPRPYGNQFNVVGTDFSCGASMLWLAAIDDAAPAAGVDRSHPAFLLSNQAIQPITANYHYVNERGFLVPSPCKAAGASCTVNSECCNSSGSMPTEACRVTLPATSPPTRTCATLSGTCSSSGGSCSTSADCCSGLACSSGFTCQPVATFSSSSFTLPFTATCSAGLQPTWRLLTWNATSSFSGADAAADNSSINFAVQTSTDNSTWSPSTAVSLVTAQQPWNPLPAPVNAVDIGAALIAAGQTETTPYVRLVVTMNPSTGNTYAPTLQDWNVSYDCLATQ